MKKLIILLFCSSMMMIYSCQIGLQKSELLEFPLPISTSSEEAKQVFLEGYTVFENEMFGSESYFKKAIELDSTFALAHLYFALSTFDITGYDKAYEFSKNASEDEKTLMKSFVDIINGNKDGALQSLEDLVQKYPKSPIFLTFQAQMHYTHNEYEQAVDLFEKALTVDSTYASAYNMLGYSYMGLKKNDKATLAFKKYLELQPKAANAHDSYADLLRETGNLDGAITHYKKAIKLDSSLFYATLKAGTSMALMNDFKNSREWLNKKMGNAGSPVSKIMFNRVMGDTYLMEGDVENGIKKYQDALKEAENVGKTDAVINLNRFIAEIYKLIENYGNADEYLEKSIERIGKSDVPEVFKTRNIPRLILLGAELAANKGDFEKAMTLVDSLNMNQFDIPFFSWNDIQASLLSHIEFRRGNLEAALEHIQQTDQKEVNELYLSALIYEAMGKHDEAREYQKKIIDLNSDEPVYALIRYQMMQKMKPSESEKAI